MSTPEENFEIARDESSDRTARETAIDELVTANDCDSLAELARMDDLDETLRERALSGMAHPQCEQLLRELAEGEELPESLQKHAETLLDDTPGDAGAGP